MSNVKINSLIHSLEQEFDKRIEYACVTVMKSQPTWGGAIKVHSLIERQFKIQKKLFMLEQEILSAINEIEAINGAVSLNQIEAINEIETIKNR